MLDKISFIIVSGDGRIRNSRLKTFFVENNLKYFVPDGVTIKDLPCYGNKHIHRYKGKNFSCSQLAAATSHQISRIFAASLNFKYFVFLEDDAEIPSEEDFISFLQVLQDRTDLERNIAIHLFPSQFGILRKCQKNDFLKIVKLPDYAVGYILSTTSLNIINFFSATNLIGVADWPQAFKKLYWYAPKSSIVTHPAQKNISYKSKIQKDKKVLQSMKIANLSDVFNFLFFKIFSLFPVFDSIEIQSERLRSRVIF